MQVTHINTQTASSTVHQDEIEETQPSQNPVLILDEPMIAHNLMDEENNKAGPNRIARSPRQKQVQPSQPYSKVASSSARTNKKIQSEAHANSGSPSQGQINPNWDN